MKIGFVNLLSRVFSGSILIIVSHFNVDSRQFKCLISIISEYKTDSKLL